MILALVPGMRVIAIGKNGFGGMLKPTIKVMPVISFII